MAVIGCGTSLYIAQAYAALREAAALSAAAVAAPLAGDFAPAVHADLRERVDVRTLNHLRSPLCP
ncbi:hypothetical protein [Streptomyces sp. NPDC056227]|uniref:hypothetical protein n=1 Tax=Streptomyces sp. NPDC056227 TaxID=3345753 RepID=UPI0035D8690F